MYVFKSPKGLPTTYFKPHLSKNSSSNFILINMFYVLLYYFLVHTIDTIVYRKSIVVENKFELLVQISVFGHLRSKKSLKIRIHICLAGYKAPNRSKHNY